MSRQRNEPNDILSEVMDYDETKVVSGTSDDDFGNESASIWPTHLNPNNLTRSQVKIWRDWVQSAYTEPTNQNIKEFAEGKEDYTYPTARKVIMRGERTYRDLEDLTSAHKLSVVLLAYEGTEESTQIFEDKYPISATTIDFCRFAYPDLIDGVNEQYGNLAKEDVEKAVNNYKNTNSFKIGQNQGQKTDEGGTRWERIKKYLETHDEGTVKGANEKLGLELTQSQISGYKANAVKSGLIPRSNDGNADKQTQAVKQEQSAPDNNKLQITLEFTDSEALELINGDTEPFDVRKRVVEKVVEKAFQ